MTRPPPTSRIGAPMSWPDPRHGDLILQVDFDAGRLRIIQADPQVWVSTVVLDEFERGNHHRDVTLNGDVLVIDAVNQRVIYRIDRDTVSRDGCAVLATWPD